MDDSRLVYSTEFGRACPECGRPVKECVCPRGKRKAEGGAPAGDGTVRVRRETKGRGGKTVTTVSGVPAGADLEALAQDLKRRCGTGGTVKDGQVVMQGDCVEKVLAGLSARGWKAKRAGG